MSIISSLGYGSGLDTAQLVAQLSAAAKAPKDKVIAARETANSASVSSLATVSNGIDSFATALRSLIAGGTLMTQPTASDDTLVGVRALTGARLGDLSAQIEIRQLAQAQTLNSATVSASSASVGQGSLALTVGGTTTNITIDAGSATIAGVAAAINGAKTGVTASVVKEGTGVRLVLKGATGADAAFTIAATPDPADSSTPAVALADLAYSPGASGGMTRAQVAQDAIVRLDGVELHRAANSVPDLIPGVAMELKKAEPGTIIAIGSARPGDAIKTAVEDFVSAFNEMKALVDAAVKPADPSGKNGGPLRGDVGMRELQRRLSRLTATPLVEGNATPRTLAEIGVVTSRTGTLSVNAATLAATIAAKPDEVEALFNPSQRSSSPFVSVTSLFGATAPGTYTLTDIVPQDGATAASGKIGGIAMTGIDNALTAPSGSPAKGLIVRATAAVASVTVSVDLGLGGALQAIRDALRASTGPLASTSSRLGVEGTQIAKDRAALEARSAAYEKQLTTQFTAMEKRVSAFKETQSFIEQQVKIWTKSS